MAENETTIAASPDAVFEVLLDANSYQEWVVGCDDIRTVDPGWPEPGSRFHHTVGTGPLKTKDTTAVISLDRPRRLELEARARPAGIATVIFEVEPSSDGSGGSTVRIKESPKSGIAKTIDNPALQLLIKARNVETLRRLKRVVEERSKVDPA